MSKNNYNKWKAEVAADKTADGFFVWAQSRGFLAEYEVTMHRTSTRERTVVVTALDEDAAGRLDPSNYDFDAGREVGEADCEIVSVTPVIPL